jgi:ADP-ribosylglycohydrolase
MWAAAMIAAAFGLNDQPVTRAMIERLLAIGMAAIPSRSRLHGALQFMLAVRDVSPTWEEAFAQVQASYGHYHWVHTINNALVVALALLYGEGEFSRSISIAVLCGWDTDCNGATVGSVLGALYGAERLPRHWTDPLNDRLRSAVIGFDNSRFSELARRFVTLRLNLAEPER